MDANHAVFIICFALENDVTKRFCRKNTHSRPLTNVYVVGILAYLYFLVHTEKQTRSVPITVLSVYGCTHSRVYDMVYQA